MNKKERKEIDINACSRSLEYIRKCLNNTVFWDLKGNINENLQNKHNEQMKMFETYIEALRFDAKGDKQRVWQLQKEKELANETAKEFERLYFEIYKAKESEIEEKYEKAYKTRIEFEKNRIEENLEYRIKIETRELKDELEKQKEINEKWKAMFTEQAMANAKLINQKKEE